MKLKTFLVSVFLSMMFVSPVYSAFNLKEMSLEEKAGQVMALAFNGTSLNDRARDRFWRVHPGGIIIYKSNVDNLQQVRDMTDSIRLDAEKRGDVLPLVAVDQEGGRVARIREAGSDFPGSMALGATDNLDLARRQAIVMGLQLCSLGIDVDFAPVVDVNSNPANPVIGVRSLGSDPRRVSEFGVAAARGFTEAGIGYSAKHFPGHGDVDIDSHLGLPVVSRTIAQLEEVEFVPFRAIIDYGVPAIMTAHVVVPALSGTLPATLSPRVISYLRQNMGFKGVILSDSMGMGAISDNWGIPRASVMALKAGVDMILLGADPGVDHDIQTEVHRSIVNAVKCGELDETRLDEAVSRILSWKEKLPLSSKKAKPDWIDASELSRHIARKSITLLSNRGKSLPLEKGDRISILWPEKYVSQGRYFAKELLKRGFETEVITFPEAEDADFKGKLESLSSYGGKIIAGAYSLRRCPVHRDFIDRLASDRTIVVSLRTPYDVMDLKDGFSALAVYSDRPASLSALADVLTGILPSGTLPVDIPGFFPRRWGCRRF